MYFKFKCPKCDKGLKVREELAGRRVACPYCSAAVQVPSPPEEEAGDDDVNFDSLKTTSSRPADRKKAAASTAGQYSDGTDVNALVSLLLGAALAVGFLVLLFPFRNLYFGELFLDRGWVPFALVFLMGWSAAILILKWRKLKKQKQSMLFDLLPTELADDIKVESVDTFHRHIHGLPVEPGSSFLINRVVRGLEHFSVRQSNPEVANMLASQSEIDANAVESSYTLLKVFIWAIPILGFIGTVIGISDAVGGFSGSLDQAQDISVLKDSLNNVTGGLSTAFDTTLVALVMSMLVMFPTTSMQKSEEDLLNWVDEYCNENLLKRLVDRRERDTPSTGGGDNRQAIRRAIDQAMTAHHAELKAWTEKLEKIGGVLSKQVAQGWSETADKAAQQWTATADASAQQWRQLGEQLAEQQKAQAEQSQQIAKASEELSETLGRVTDQAADLQTRLTGSIGESAQAFETCLSSLESGLVSLGNVLESLGEKQVVVQQQPVAKRGWLFGRRNGG